MEGFLMICESEKVLGLIKPMAVVALDCVVRECATKIHVHLIRVCEMVVHEIDGRNQVRHRFGLVPRDVELAYDLTVSLLLQIVNVISVTEAVDFEMKDQRSKRLVLHWRKICACGCIEQ